MDELSRCKSIVCDSSVANSINGHLKNIETRIFCYGEVDKASNKLSIGCIAYARKDGIVAKLFKI